MKSCSLILRSLLLLLLLAAVGSCSVYNRIFHPYRIPNPPPSPEHKAKLKAEKERKKAFSRANAKKKEPTPEVVEEGSTDDSAPTTDVTATDAAKPAPPQAPKLKYDKKGLMKKKQVLPKKRTKVVKPSLWQRVKNVFRKKRGKKKQSTPKPPPDVSSPTDPNSIP